MRLLLLRLPLRLLWLNHLRETALQARVVLAEARNEEALTRCDRAIAALEQVLREATSTRLKAAP